MDDDRADRRLLTTTDLAAELQVPMATLDQWAYLGRGPVFMKLGRHRRYRREDVDAWLASRRRGGSTVEGA